MVDYAIMGGILAFLLFVLLFGAKYISDGNDGFFNFHNTNTMRGFWCLIVILAHIPQAYQNTIQNMVGSFAYIGVTFFFMTSAYGLSVGVHKEPKSIKTFWRSRLPKLVIPNWAINIVIAFLFLIMPVKSIGVSDFIRINDWVIWLLACYIIFWIAYYFNWKEKYRIPIVCSLVFILSISVYWLQRAGIIKLTTWCPESIGFILGTILFAKYRSIKQFFSQMWIIKVVFAGILSLVLGVLYLYLKHIVFWGDYVLKIILGLSILCFILILNTKIKIGNKITYFLGSISYEVFLIHSAIFKIIEKAFPNLSSGSFILVSILFTIVLAAIIHKAINFLLNKLQLPKKT